MVRNKPIICGGCNRDTGYTEEQFMFYVATSNVLCPHCGYVIIHANNGIEYNSNPSNDPKQMHNLNVHTSSNMVNLKTNLDL